MKIISGLILASSLLIASSFEQDVDYVCQNTAVVEGGEKTELDMSKSLGMPFSFTIKGKELISTNGSIFDYKMQRNEMVSYSNIEFMLLLMPENELALVPRESKGQVQYLFKCESK